MALLTLCKQCCQCVCYFTQSVMPTWNHDGDPVSCLMINDTVDKLKVRMYVYVHHACVHVMHSYTAYVS